MDATESHRLSDGAATVSVLAKGAELCSLQDGAGQEYLWQAGPAWPRHAPVLFPIVGRLRDDTLMHNGKSYRMTQHGFARDMRFAWTERSATGCKLVLTDDEATRQIYPFAFRFEIGYAVAGGRLDVTYAITNTGQDILPASMGAHPAFRWPLQAGLAKTDYALTFENDEPAKLRRVSGGLLMAAEVPSPIAGRLLALRENLFADDALILPAPASRWVRFAAAEGPGLTVSWQGFQQLGIWSRAGGDFLCIEPWCGMASPVDFAGDFMRKPWLLLVPPGESRVATWSVEIK